MRRRLLLITAVLLSASPMPPASANSCSGDDEYGIVVECEREQNSTNEATTVTTTHLSVEYFWGSACRGTTPGETGSESVDCELAHVCPDQRLVLMSLFSRQVRDGRPIGPWQHIRSECRDPAAPRDQPRTLTTADVLSAIRSIGLPTNQIHGPAYTLVNLDTTFSTTPHPLHRTLTILGYTVTINAQPTTYTWNWDDGTTTHTSTPGRPYPHTDITHTYTHPTDHQPPLTPSIDTTYHARYRVDHGPWTTIPDPITTHGPTHQLPVKQATAVLVQPD